MLNWRCLIETHAVLLFLFVCGFGPCVSASTWDVEVFDTNVVGARNISTAIDSLGDVHVVYYDKVATRAVNLMYAVRRSGIWLSPVVIETNSSTGPGRRVSMGLDSNDIPHISYDVFSSTGGNPVLRYATLNGSNWEIETIDNSGMENSDSSLVVDAAGSPHVIYTRRDSQFGYYGRYAVRTPTGWVTEQIDPTGKFMANDLSLGLNGEIHVVGEGSGGGAYARRDGIGWIIESIGSPILGNGAIAVSDNDQPHIFTRGVGDDLYYVTKSGQNWQTQFVAHTGPVGLTDVSIVIGPDGKPRVSYEVDFDRSGKTYLHHAVLSGVTWSSELVDDAFLVQSGAALAVDQYGTSHLAYWTGDLEMRYAMKLIPEPASLVLFVFAICNLGFRRST